MAVSTIPASINKKIIYTGGGTYTNDIGSTIQLADSVAKYSVIRLGLYAGSYTSSARRFVYLNTMYSTFSASYFLYATPTGYGSLRIEAAGSGTGLMLLSGTESSMYLAEVYGIS